MLDLAGKEFGKLTAVKFLYSKKKQRMWQCKCQCGNTTIASVGLLRSGRKQSCGCLGRIEEIKPGTKLGSLTVVEKVTPASGKSFYLCQCKCGLRKNVEPHDLVSGKMKSCGRIGCKASAKHRMSGTKEYKTWTGMKARCKKDDPHIKRNYKDAGVTVCEEWIESFEAFLGHVGFAPSSLHQIDRIDPKKGYSRGNVRWVTTKEQQRNKRKPCQKLTYNGVTMLAVDWAKKVGLTRQCIYARIKAGWEVEDILFRPLANNAKQRK